MKLAPLKQFICDTCGKVINAPEEGLVEMIYNEELHYTRFTVVHHRVWSPRRPYDNCEQGLACDHLDNFLGPKGLSAFLAMLDPGPHIKKQCESPHRVVNIREWVDVVRRLHLPYYEEARQFFAEAMEEGYFVGENELSMFVPTNLRELIMEYSPE